MKKKILKGFGIVVFFGIIIWFLQPLFVYGLTVGNIFGVLLCLAGIFLILFYKKLADKNKLLKWFMRISAAVYCTGLCWCVFLTVLMLQAQYTKAESGHNVIVLGAQIYDENSLSLTMRQRVSAAKKYLDENKDSICIVTGGQGSNEPCTEALAQRNWFVSNGIDGSKIVMEDESTSTRENLRNSLKLAEEQGLSNEFVISTQGFHMFRALQIAKEEGVNASPLVAETEPLLYPGYYGRELMSLTKWIIEHILFY